MTEMTEMSEKERLYKLYEAEYLVRTYIQTNLMVIKVLKVPGGWIINDIFVPFNNEKQEYAYEPSEEIITIRCNNKSRPLEPIDPVFVYNSAKCGHQFQTKKFEDFQKQIYKCPECGGIVDLNYLVKKNAMNSETGEKIITYLEENNKWKLEQDL